MMAKDWSLWPRAVPRAVQEWVVGAAKATDTAGQGTTEASADFHHENAGMMLGALVEGRQGLQAILHNTCMTLWKAPNQPRGV